MLRFRQVILTTQVWLTAAAVGLAGLPHFHCRCAHAPNQPVVLVALPADSGCCCGGGCCTPNEGASCCRDQGPPAEETDCCHDEIDPRDEQQGQLNLASAPAGCTGTLAHAEAFAAAPGRAAVPDGATAIWLWASPSDVVPNQRAPSARLAWEAGRLPPPTDPVIAFRHLLI